MPKHPLKHPITIGKRTIDTLTFRDFATADDLLAFDQGGPTQQTIHLIANLTGTAPEIIGKLHVHDFRACDAIANELIKPEDRDEKNLDVS